MGDNINRFMAGLLTQITYLCRNLQPVDSPASIAWTYFRAGSGPQLPQVNEWVEIQLDLPAVTRFDTTWKDVGKNGKNYCANLTKTINAFAAEFPGPSWTPQEIVAWLWFNDFAFRSRGPRPQSEADAPKEVIDWVKPRLPGATLRRRRQSRKPSRRKGHKLEVKVVKRALRRAR